MRRLGMVAELLLGMLACLGVASAQVSGTPHLTSNYLLNDDAGAEAPRLVLADAPPILAAPLAQPRMAPELALQTYLQMAGRQLSDLGEYSDTTIIEAVLPESSQHGKYELRRLYRAPKSLVFRAHHFAGDGFVKTNVIARLLQSEVDHVEKGEGARTAIVAENYKLGFKGQETLDSNSVYVFQVRPREKRPGLFKGKIYLDVSTGHLRRAEGSMVKSPSFFVKKIDFVQDYADFGSFSLPVKTHSEAKTRLVGRAIVDILHTDYQARSLAEVQAAGVSAATATAADTN